MSVFSKEVYIYGRNKFGNLRTMLWKSKLILWKMPLKHYAGLFGEAKYKLSIYIALSIQLFLNEGWVKQ